MLSKVLALAIFMASVQAFTINLSPKANGEIKECLAGTTDWFGNYKLDVTPMPINLANGNEVTVDGEITLKQAIEQGSKVAISLELPWAISIFPWVGNISIPCVEVVNYVLTFHIFIAIKNIYLFHFRSLLVCTLDLASTILVMIFCHVWIALVNVVNSFQKVKLVHFH